MKTCRVCNRLKPVSEFYASPRNVGGLQTNCKACSSVLCRNWREQNKDRRSEYQRRYREEFYDDLLRRSRENQARIRATSEGRARLAAKAKQEREALSDHYVKSVLVAGTGISRIDITAELIGIKRDELRLKRLSRMLKQAASKESNEAFN